MTRINSRWLAFPGGHHLRHSDYTVEIRVVRAEDNQMAALPFVFWRGLEMAGPFDSIQNARSAAETFYSDEFGN